MSAFQVGRFFDGGGSAIGFATSTNGGATWTSGFLPGITKFQGGGPFDRASDPAVAYDPQDNVWMISSLALSEAGGVHGAAVVTSRSTNGGLTWSNPVTTATGSNLDKNWIVCDTTATSPFFGNCYTQYDDNANGNRMKMRRSTNGGLTWGAALNTGDAASGLGGQPVVRPNGTVHRPLPELLRPDPLVPLHRRRRQLAGHRPGLHHPSPHRRRWAADQPAALGRDRLGRHRLCGVAGLPVPLWLCRQRHRHEQVHQRDHLGAGHPGPDRRHLQHRGPLHPRHRGGPRHLRRQRPHRADLLLLPQPQLHRGDLPAGCRVHLLDQRGRQLEPSDPAGRADDAVVACQHLPGPHGRRLHLHLRPQWRQRLPGHRRRPSASGTTFNEAMYVPTGGLPITGGARQALTGPVLAPSGTGRLAAPGSGSPRSAR